ncbi:MAG: hypothetical protein AAF542_21095 [Pseudomonadota bacterium]
MSRSTQLAALGITLLVGATNALADESGELVLDVSSLAAPDTVSREEGLAAWSRIHDVFTHPRCLNCHVGEDNIPLWTTDLPNSTRAHGMWITGGVSRIGAETLLCNSCHQKSSKRNTVPNAAPHSGMIWRLAPIEFQWTNKSGPEICEQVRNPDTNGSRDGMGLIEHILHDAKEFGFISWGFDPGPGRSRPLGSLQSHLEDMAIWTSAGLPCPES